ncbi:hypothetical protein G5714_003965 [Onychostoma macrolepis]|uniref:Interferon-induced very large GTPase 1-like n=1 Tax=Onychostoma macrolepis TaxID=369639 RepID=A0A7J6DAX1_9TELE|nr:hypothetical protein G5714_003965 [Onychostoma macrolepis]
MAQSELTAAYDLAHGSGWSIDPPPNLSDLRIVLLGKNVSENSGVGNFILGRAAFDSEAPPDVVERVGGRLKHRRVIIINSPQLLQTNISDHQITQTVRECVYLSEPGPHVFIIILQYKDFTEEDIRRVKTVLKEFSEEAIKRTMVITTDEETRDAEGASVRANELIKQLNSECGGGQLQLDHKNKEWCSIILQRLEKILRENGEEYLTRELYHDTEGSSVDEDWSTSFVSLRTEEEEDADDDGKSYTRTKKKEAKGFLHNIPEMSYFSTPHLGLERDLAKRSVHASRKQKLCVVLCGSDGKLKAFVSKLIRGKNKFLSPLPLKEKECAKRDVELPALTRLSEEEVMRQAHQSVSLCDPGVHVFLLIIPDAPLSDADKAEIEMIQRVFSSRIKNHLMMSLQSFGGRQFVLENGSRVPDLLQDVENMVQENRGSYYTTFMYLQARVELERNKHRAEIEELRRSMMKAQSTAGLTHNYAAVRIVLLGKTGVGKSATGNTILRRDAFISKLTSRSVTRECQKETSEFNRRRVTVIDTPGLFDTGVDNVETRKEIVKCISMAAPGPHVFLLVIPLGRFTQEEKDAVKMIQEMFGDKSRMYTMVLFTRGDDLRGTRIEDFIEANDSLQYLIYKCGKRYHVFNNNETTDQRQVSALLDKIDCMVAANGGSFYTSEMFQQVEKNIKGEQDRIMKEKEEEIKRKEEELRANYEAEIEQMKENERERQMQQNELRKSEEEFRKREEEIKKETDENLQKELQRKLGEKQKLFEEENKRKEKALGEQQQNFIKYLEENHEKEKQKLQEKIHRETREQAEREYLIKLEREVAKALKEAEEQLPCSAKRACDWSLYGGFIGAAAGNLVGSYEDRKSKNIGTTGIKVEKIDNLFHRLHLEDRHHNKLRPADVLQITKHSLQSHESCAEEKLIQIFIQKLLMLNYRARYLKAKENNEENHIQQRDYDPSNEGDIFHEMSLSNDRTSQSEQIHPMDVQMAVFHCADGLLKQLMVTKLSQCQYALPLLVPDPFTQQIEFPLWTFRQIKKSWKMRNTNNEIISQTQPIYKAETPMVFFFRFGSVSSSKSQLMNSLINEKHNTFFHRNCTGSSRTRVLMDGVVEITWFCPSGSNDDKFTECVAFCNLHGDAGDHEKQLQILTKMASVNVVLLPRLQRYDRRMKKLDELYKGSKPLICLFTEDETAVTVLKEKCQIGLKNRNQSEVSEELRRVINDCLSESSSTFRLEDVSKHSDIRVDEEDDDDCRRGREAAQQMMSLLEMKSLKEIKESFLPHQGKLWHQWSQKNKELHRPQPDETKMDISRKQIDLKKIREQQHASDISEFVKLFIKEMNTDAEHEKMFFIKWIGILLDKHISADLSALHHKYNEKWSTVLTMNDNKNKSEQLTTVQIDLERISEELQAATFGLEHIMREIGQIYESCSSVKKNKKDLQVHFSSLPSLAAEMMISGFPLELMDGDAAHVPLVWISAVLDQLIQKLGDQRLFVLSVLGLQSSGKSTILNAMFGLQFAVGAGRCTRGAFMQLVRVSDEMKTQLNFDYILVIDTEGLRALELGRLSRHHDNELATFAVAIGNLTLINIFGENPSELQDILQIVVQAFMRMKKVRLNPSCVFVCQNVSDVKAGEKNMEGRRRLQMKLDDMTKVTAKEEECDAECFSDVTEFDVQKDVKYFTQLWEGRPPMAPPNPVYCESIQELKETIMSFASKSHGIMLIDLKVRIKDLWEALRKEQFIFSFSFNAVEISAYRTLEREYNKWSWSLHSAMMETENKLHNKIENGTIHEVEETDLKREDDK